MNKISAIIVLLLLIITAGCRGNTRPVSYYTLAPLPVAASEHSQLPKNHVSIGVGPAIFPEYINKPQIITRDGSAKIRYSEFHRWAGSLEKAFLRVVAENLSVILNTDRVDTYPWSEAPEPLYQVKLDIKQFDGRLREQVILNVIWKIVDNSESNPPIVRRSVITEPADGQGTDDYARLVLAQSRALERLSREIAGVISEQYATHGRVGH